MTAIIKSGSDFGHLCRRAARDWALREERWDAAAPDGLHPERNVLAQVPRQDAQGRVATTSFIVQLLVFKRFFLCADF